MQLTRIIRTVALASLFVWGHGHTASAAEDPIITFHTNVYDNVGETNAFHFYLGATEPVYVDVDCGFGTMEAEVGVASYDPEAGGIAGTAISCTVSSEGMVRIYGDASKIDYIDMEGCYISDISFPQLTEVQILNLSHNELNALDLTHMTKLQALYLSDNPFTVAPLVVGVPKPDLSIVEMSIIDHLDSSFDLAAYPAMRSFEAWHVPDLTRLDPTNCPGLLRLSVDATNISSIDVSRNPSLLILNVADTKVTELDLTNNNYLTELYCGHRGSFNSASQMMHLDLGSKPELQRLFCEGNALTQLDLSGCPKLLHLSASANRLTTLSLDPCPDLVNVNITGNKMNFATLPSPRETFNEYYYAQQPLEVDRSYAVGSTIDFRSRVLREGTVTQAFLFSVSETQPESPTMLTEDYYTYADGLLTLNKTLPDSVMVTFINSELQDYPLSTAKFMVKTADEIGKPSPVAEMTFYPTVRTVSLSVGMQGATPEHPRTFSVDFGSGQLVEFTATTSLIPSVPNVTGTRSGHVTIYMPENEDISALAIDGQRLMSIDLAQARTLEQLSITDCLLPVIDLSWNRCLRTLDLSGNNFSTLDLSEPNGNYGKNVLTDLTVARNQLTEIDMGVRPSIRKLDLSDNNLSTLDLSKLTNMESLDLSGNQLTEIDLRDGEALASLDLSGNLLSEITIPDYVPLTKLDLSGNNFTFRTLPLPSAVTADDYTYAPQRPMVIPTKAPSLNLTANYLDSDGQVTAYTWRMADGSEVPEGSIVGSEGRFRFVRTDLGLVYCDMTHPLFPDFNGANVYTTTRVETAPMPTHQFATFTTAEAGTATFVLAGGTEGTTVYVDWTGHDDFEQYILSTRYKVFTSPTTAGTTVRCFSYDDDDDVTVFSISDVRLSSVDVSPMQGLKTFTCSRAGLDASHIILPSNPAALEELSLDDNDIAQIDLSKFTSLKMLNLSLNRLTTYDASAFPTLEVLLLDGNDITSVRFSNPVLWYLSLAENSLSEVNLTGLPNLEQLYLRNNYLSTIDISQLPSLIDFDISGNRFTFATLPEGSSLGKFGYANQAPLDVTPENGSIVDLSSQAMCRGTATDYTWYIDTPYYDEEGNLVGENLYEDIEYRIENGVTSFIKPFSHVMCVMTNEVYPSLILYTGFMDIVASSSIEMTEAVPADETADWFDLNGVHVARTAPGELPSLAGGVYVRLSGGKAIKVVVK